MQHSQPQQHRLHPDVPRPRSGLRAATRTLIVTSLVALVSGAATYSLAKRHLPTGVRESKFFKVDMDKRRIVSPTERAAAALRLDFVSVSTDQPQYWPHERVYLKVLALGAPGAELTGKLQKRDANSRDIKGKLDEQGALVVTILDGSSSPLELGEYRLDVTVRDKLKGSATFAVVQGSLGAVAFAHEWKKVTNVTELEQRPGGWFLGNAGGAGMRWGNGLSYKNELRVSNRPWSGPVEIHSRCMLPGCNGVDAGPAQTVKAENGVIQGTLNVGGHSGPFQIEVITSRGSLRHQFEGSSHVERDMVAVSGGVSYSHRVGLAPYEQTVQVPGRDLFVESKAGGDDPFAIDSVIAARGKLALTIKQNVSAPMLVVHQPKSDGSFTARSLPITGELKAGRKLEVEVAPPYSLITIGGFVDAKGDDVKGKGQKEFKEGWALGFAPTELTVDIEAPIEGRALSKIPVKLSLSDAEHKPVKASAIVEVYDSRVPSRSPGTLLGSALGDSMRSASRSVSSWSDNTGWIEDPDPEPRVKSPSRPRKMMMEKEMDAILAPAPAASGLSLRGSGVGGGGTGYGSIGLGSMGSIGYGKASGAPPPPAPPPPPGMPASSSGPKGSAAASAAEVREEVREDERKMVFCQLVTTDDSGAARLEVELPPQLGRMIVRAVAVRGLDYRAAEKQLDVRREAAADAHLPRTFIKGAELVAHIDVNNHTKGELALRASGPFLPQSVERTVGIGAQTVDLPLSLQAPGALTLELRDKGGQILDRREQKLASVSEVPVTTSRLVFGDGGSLPIGSRESARVYAGAGPLLRGMVMNVQTTVESWFGHAEALSARAAVRAVLLASIQRGLLSDEGLGHQLRTGVDKDVRDLKEAFCTAEGLCRPYPSPSLAPSPLWSAWVARNLEATARALQKASQSDVRVRNALATSRELAKSIRAALAAKGHSVEQLAGTNANGDDVIPVEINGQVVWRVLTDDAVTRWASDRLLPMLDLDQKDADVAFSKAFDSFRFLRAFERVGSLQYLTELATAYYLQGDVKTFARLYQRVARGLILSQEPGLLQGPALLGGVYSTPMALVRFLELQLLIGEKQPKASGLRYTDGKPLGFEETITGSTSTSILLPPGAIARIDRPEIVRLQPTPPSTSQGRAAQVTVQKTAARVGEELTLEVTLDAGRDPLEYYAIVAVPTTTSIKQTEDILSDYRGQLIYGQQGQGGTQAQLIAVPFRGARSLRLLLEGAYRGRSPGVVVIRHIEGALPAAGLAIPEVRVD